MPDTDIPTRIVNTTINGTTPSLAAATVFTPTVAGNFRVAMFLVIADGNVGGGTLQFSWTDDSGYLHTFNGSASYSDQHVVRSGASQPIQVVIPAFVTGSSLSFVLYVTVEQL